MRLETTWQLLHLPVFARNVLEIWINKQSCNTCQISLTCRKSMPGTGVSGAAISVKSEISTLRPKNGRAPSVLPPAAFLLIEKIVISEEFSQNGRPDFRKAEIATQLYPFLVHYRRPVAIRSPAKATENDGFVVQR